MYVIGSLSHRAIKKYTIYHNVSTYNVESLIIISYKHIYEKFCAIVDKKRKKIENIPDEKESYH